MTCAQVAEDELVEKYVLGRLSEAEREVFEQHFFECPDCLETLQNYQALHVEVREAAATIRAEAKARTAHTRWRWTWVAASAAAAVVIVAVGWWLGTFERGTGTTPPVVTAPRGAPRPQPGISRESLLKELARVEPPPYEPAVLRRGTNAARQHFRDAMQHYLKSDYAATISGLLDAAKLDPQAPGTHFFLGICYLLTEKTDDAIRELQQTITLGESPYLEEAHFYLAKAFLRTNNLQAAQRELQKTAELEGDLRGEAKRLLGELETLMKAPH